MDNSYELIVNNDFTFQFSESQLQELDAIPNGEKTMHLLHHSKSYEIQLLKADFNTKNYTLKVNGNRYEVSISNGLDLLIKKMGFSKGAFDAIGSIEAPMPGLILDINVVEGQQVKVDEPLLVLEAMKMENVIASPRDGVIKAVSVVKGEAVEKKHVLIEFE